MNEKNELYSTREKLVGLSTKWFLFSRSSYKTFKNSLKTALEKWNMLLNPKLS